MKTIDLATMKSYNIVDFGAYPSDLLMTDKIQAAIDTCAANGGGQVIVPEGTFRTGGLILKSGVYLHLLSGAELEGSRYGADYPGPERKWLHALIKAWNEKNIGIIGEKYSRLNGMNCYDPDGEEGYRGPHGIVMDHCENVILQGYEIRDAGNWSHNLRYCSNMEISFVGIFGGHDGVDIHCCTDTIIQNCNIHTGDDAIAGFGNENCTIRDCVLDSSCSIARFGGNDCLFERCTSPYPAQYGHRYKMSLEAKKASMNDGSQTRHGTGALFNYYCDKRWPLTKNAGNIVFKDCTFDHPGTLFTMCFDGRNQWCCYKPLDYARFENCTMLGVSNVMNFLAAPDDQLTLEFKNCRITADESLRDKPFASICYCKHLILDNVTLEGYNDPCVVLRSPGEVTVTGGTPVRLEHTTDPNDTVLTFDEISEKLKDLPADFDAWKSATDAIPTPDEARWDKDYGMYRPAGKTIGHDHWATLLAAFRDETPHTEGIARSCVGRYGYLAAMRDGKYGLVTRDYNDDENNFPSALYAGPLAYCYALDTPISARAFISDFLRSQTDNPVAVAGMKLAMEKIKKDLGI